MLPNLVQDLIKDLNKIIDGVYVAASPVESGQLSQLMKTIGRRLAKFRCKQLEDIAMLAASCTGIISVDGGLLWAVVSGLNYLAWKAVEFQGPDIHVVIGRDAHGNLAPAAKVWKPLYYDEHRVFQVNANQEKKLIELTSGIILEQIK